MTWNMGGGGPSWGGGSYGGGRGPQNPNQIPPEVEELIRKAQAFLKKVLAGKGGEGKVVGRAAMLGVAAVAALWGASGFYRVQPDEQGVVMRFGEAVRTTPPGLNYHLPWPVEQVVTPKVTRVNRVEVGFRAGADGGQFQGGFQQTSAQAGPAGQVPEEALMLTGDENIVDINFSVFWVIKDAREYLFNVRSPEVVVKAAAESAMREVIGRTPISTVIAEGRREIEARAQTLLQEILDHHKAGISVTQVQLQKVDPPQPVIDAFRDVQRARADQERLRNEAEAYRNDVIPRARGEAERLVQEAEAYRQEVFARAQGDTARFNALLDAYEASPSIMRTRLYMETKREVLGGVAKVLLDPTMEGQNVLPYLPLPGPGRNGQQQQAAPAVPLTSLQPATPNQGVAR